MGVTLSQDQINKRCEELLQELAVERERYESIRSYFSSPEYTLKNLAKTNEVAAQLVASNNILAKFRAEYAELMALLTPNQ